MATTEASYQVTAGQDQATHAGLGRQRDPSLELVFLLGGCGARRAALHEQTRVALCRADFDRLAEELAWRRVLPLIGGRAIAAGEGLCPPSFHSAVTAAKAKARAQGLAVEFVTQQVSALLAQKGIRSLPLKGPFLAAAAHGDIGLRETDDVDLLVAPSDLHEAAHVLTAEGFRPMGDPLRKNGWPDLHLTFRRQGQPAVELHWRIHWYDKTFSQRMLERAVEGADGMLKERPDDLGASILLFYARDGLYGVRFPADLGAWWDRIEHSLPPRALEGHASEHSELLPAFTAAAVAAEHITGVPTRGWLGDATASGRRVELAARLADWIEVGDRDQLAANLSLADGLLAPWASTRDFVRRELVPDSGATAPHAVKMLARYGAALWRLRRGRRWVDPPGVPRRRAGCEYNAPASDRGSPPSTARARRT